MSKSLHGSRVSLHRSRVSLLWLHGDPPQLPEFQFDLNPDSAFYTDADLDPSIHFDACNLNESVIFCSMSMTDNSRYRICPNFGHIFDFT
jgi:hypothetical protein